MPNMSIKEVTIMDGCDPFKINNRGEFLKMMKLMADKYREDAKKSLSRNTHMNDLTKTDIVKLNKRQIDAILVDFINYIGVNWGVDYGLHTYHLGEEDDG